MLRKVLVAIAAIAVLAIPTAPALAGDCVTVLGWQQCV